MECVTGESLGGLQGGAVLCVARTDTTVCCEESRGASMALQVP